MAGIINESSKGRTKAGQRPSAETWNRMVGALSRENIGPGTIHGSEGSAIPRGGGGGGGALRFCVLRTVNTGTPLIEVQRVIEQRGETKLAGEEGQRFHIGVVGSVFVAYPQVGGTYDQYNIAGAIRPVADIIAPENLSGAALFTFDNAKRLTLVYRWAANIAYIDPEAEEAGGGGV